jgi:hypothetical protein
VLLQVHCFFSTHLMLGERNPIRPEIGAKASAPHGRPSLPYIRRQIQNSRGVARKCSDGKEVENNLHPRIKAVDKEKAGHSNKDIK